MPSRKFYEQQIERYQEALDLLARYPETDPYPDGTVLRFNRRSTPGGRLYAYAAIRAAQRWYTTAARDPIGGRNWAQFVEWLSDKATDLVVMAPAGDSPVATTFGEADPETMIRRLIKLAKNDPDRLDQAMDSAGIDRTDPGGQISNPIKPSGWHIRPDSPMGGIGPMGDYPDLDG